MANNLQAIHTTNAQEAETKKMGWGKFDKSKRRMFLRFTSCNGRTWDDKLGETLCKLLRLSTAAEVHEY